MSTHRAFCPGSIRLCWHTACFCPGGQPALSKHHAFLPRRATGSAGTPHILPRQAAGQTKKRFARPLSKKGGLSFAEYGKAELYHVQNMKHRWYKAASAAAILYHYIAFPAVWQVFTCLNSGFAFFLNPVLFKRSPLPTKCSKKATLS